MIENRTNLQCYLLLVLIFFKLLGAQEVPNTSSNQGGSPSSLQSRFSDDGATGFRNFGSGRFGNPTSNYPTNSFFPFGNQNKKMQRTKQGSGFSYPKPGNFENRPQGYPNQRGFPNLLGHPYQEDSMNPNPNYKRPQYFNQNIQNRDQGAYPNQDAYPYEGDSNNRYPNHHRPSYPNSPDVGSIMNPDDISRSYKRGMPTNQGGPGQSSQYPSQNNQYPYRGNFPGTGYPNDIMNPNLWRDDFGNLPSKNIHFPDRLQIPDQYYPQTNPQNQNFRPVQGQIGNFPNNSPDNNIHFPTNYQGGVNVDPPAIQYPNQVIPNPGRPRNVLPGSSVNPGLNNVFQNQAPLTINQGNIPSYNGNDKVAILGKPVIVPPTATSPSQAVLDNSTAETATQNKCVQDCPTTSEYNPVCGTDNVTYINPGKYKCAQRCGVAVHLKRKGRCHGDIVHNALKLSYKKKKP